MNIGDIFGKDDKKEFEKKEWKEIKPEPKLVPVLQQSIVKWNEGRKQDSPTEFRASEIGGCDRKYLYKQSQVEEIDWQSYLVMNMGTVIHELLQSYLKDHLISLEERLYFNLESGDSSPNTLLSGSYDGELDGKLFNEKKNVLLEIKTTGVSNYQRLITNKGQLSNKYKLQNNVYLHAKGLDRTAFIFFNRNIQFTDEFIEQNKDIIDTLNPVFHEITYYKDDALVEKIRQKITDRKLHKSLGTMPKRDKTSECSYCSFKSVCDADNQNEKAARRAEKSAKTKQEKEIKKKGVK